MSAESVLQAMCILRDREAMKTAFLPPTHNQAGLTPIVRILFIRKTTSVGSMRSCLQHVGDGNWCQASNHQHPKSASKASRSVTSTVPSPFRSNAGSVPP